MAMGAAQEARATASARCGEVLADWAAQVRPNRRVWARDFAPSLTACLRRSLESLGTSPGTHFASLRWAAPVGPRRQAIALSYYEKFDEVDAQVGWLWFTLLARNPDSGGGYGVAGRYSVRKYNDFAPGDSSAQLARSRDCDADGFADLVVRYAEDFEGEGSVGDLCLGSSGKLSASDDAR